MIDDKNEFAQVVLDKLYYDVDGRSLISTIENSGQHQKDWIRAVLISVVTVDIWNTYVINAGPTHAAIDNNVVAAAVDYLLCKLTVCYFLTEVVNMLKPLYPKKNIKAGLYNFTVESDGKEKEVCLFLENDIDLSSPAHSSKWIPNFNNSDPLDLNVLAVSPKERYNNVYYIPEVKNLKNLNKEYFVEFIENEKGYY